MQPSYQHVCGGCDLSLPGKHLRVNFANPDRPWQAMRFHDLSCLLDFLEEEEDADGAGKVFTQHAWIDALSPL